MKVEYKSQNEVSQASAKAATGRTLDDWYAHLDSRGGPSQGRRVLMEYLYRQMKVDPWWATTLIVEYEKARGVYEKDGHPKGYNICVTKALTVSHEAAINEFADGSWWLGEGVKVAEGAEFDAGDGHRGVFKKVAPGKVIRFTWSGANHHPGEVVEVKCTEAAGKTSLMINHDRIQTRAAADGMRDAWAAVLNTLKARLQ